MEIKMPLAAYKNLSGCSEMVNKAVLLAFLEQVINQKMTLFVNILSTKQQTMATMTDLKMFYFNAWHSGYNFQQSIYWHIFSFNPENRIGHLKK